jgi:arsenate reductase
VYSAGTEPAAKVNPKAVTVMKEAGIDISHHQPRLVEEYLEEAWDYVITVCDHAKETCPMFLGQVKHRLHMGFEDPSDAVGSDAFIWSEFRRVRDEIYTAFKKFYSETIQPQTAI